MKDPIAITHPHIAEEWHLTKNSKLTPFKVTPGSGKKVWWVCFKNGHEYDAMVNNRCGKKRGCPYCSGNKACIDNCLATLKPEIAKEWHPTKNGDLTPFIVTSNSNKIVWWVCSKNHGYDARIADRRENRGCPYCSGRKAYIDTCLETLRPDIASEWHSIKNGDLTPFDVTPGSTKKVWWKCSNGHDFDTRISHRCNRISRSSCPYCSGRKVCIDNCLATVKPDIASEWHPTKNGYLTSFDFTPGSDKKVWWRCKNSHNYKAIIGNRCHKTNSTGCPYCLYKTEEKVRYLFENRFKKEFPRVRPKWLINPKTGYSLELDGYCKILKLAFEYDGEWHERDHPRAKQGSVEDQKERDRLTTKGCKKQGVTLIRIPYTQKKNLERFIRKKLKSAGIFPL